MSNAVDLVEVIRGPFAESVHRGHAVVVTPSGEVVAAWGDPEAVVLPRSSSKILQAMAMVESGAAARAGLGSEHLALACASHEGAAVHTGRVAVWLSGLGLGEADLRCGAHDPGDPAALADLHARGAAPCQLHNNCSGKHAGFLTLNRDIGGDPDYVAPAHPVQQAARAVFEEMTGATSPGFGIDGCSAPNFAGTLRGIATAMARIAAAETALTGARRSGAIALRDAMAAHPVLVAGEGRACTELMTAMGGRAMIKTGAEGFFVAMLPGRGLGVAIKILDGATRGAEGVMAALLVRLGVADPDHPLVAKRLRPALVNRAGRVTGMLRPTHALWQDGTLL